MHNGLTPIHYMGGNFLILDKLIVTLFYPYNFYRTQLN